MHRAESGGHFARDGADHKPLVGFRWTSVQDNPRGTRQGYNGCRCWESKREIQGSENGEALVSNPESGIRNTVLDTSDVATKALLVCGVVASLLFNLAWLGEGAARANYDPLRHTISSLSLGEHGWMQVASFIITGLLILAFSIGLRRALRPSGSVWGPLLVGLVGVGKIGGGIFVTDPFNGYPPGTPRIPTEHTTHGILHGLFGVLFFIGLPISCFVFARLFARLGERRWAAYSGCSGFAMFALFFLLVFADIARLFGLFQRITVIIGFAWITLLALHMLKGLATPSENRAKVT